MKLSLNMESVNALRELADYMPVAIENIVNDTNELFNVYNSLADEVGPHNEQFLSLINYVKSMQEKAEDAIEELPPQLRRTADKIEAYIGSSVSAGGK